MPDGTLVFDTQIDKKGFQNGMSDLERETDRLGSTFKGTFGGVVASQMFSQGVEMLVDFGKAAVSTASDLAEVQNVVDVTFGQGADTIETFAKTAMANFGLTELQAKQYSSTIGAMLKSMGLADSEVLSMSQNMTALVGDMASFYNLDHETAFQKLRSGLSGETEPLKQLGINLSVANLEAYALAEGLGKTYDQMTEAERVNLRFSYIMQATADAQGDFVRTSDGFANQLRILQGNLSNIAADTGEKLLPALTSGLQLLNSLFAGTEENKTLAEIDSIVSSLGGIPEKLNTLQAQYAQTDIRINLNYTRAEGLVEDLAALEKLPDTPERAAAMQEITNSLVAMYPELSKYVGENGVFAMEAAQVDVYIEKLHQAQKEQAMTTLASGYMQAYQQAVMEYNRLGTIYGEAATQYDEATRKVQALDDIGSVALAMDLQPGTVADETVAAAINQYVEAFGGLEGIDTAALGELGRGISDLFGETGQINVGGLSMHQLEQMYALFQLIDEETMGGDVYAEQEAAEIALDTAERNLGAKRDELTLAAETLTEAEQIISDTWGDGSTPVIDYAAEAQGIIDAQMSKVGTSISTNLDTGASDGINAVISRLTGPDARQRLNEAGEIDGSVYGSGFNAGVGETIRLPGGIGSTDGSHATGLSRVPYDNYIARLHSGEAVLSAGEAERWRTGSSIDYGAIAAAVAAALPNGGSGVTKLYIDGVELASTQASNNRSALAVRSSMESRGYGKR